MRLSDFESMVRRMSGEVPEHFFDGVAEVVVSPRTVPHPTREDIYTLGECIPLPAEGEDSPVQSRIVLYHGSFRALARLSEEFDWRGEAWETLTHELRHHLEWRARAPDLEELDWAMEQNFARQDGESFDAAFHLAGDRLDDGVYRLEDDVFLDIEVEELPERIEFGWHGRRWSAPVAMGTTLPAFLSVEGVRPEPDGELVLVVRARPRLRDLFRRGAPVTGTVRAEPLSTEPAADGVSR